MKNRSIEEVISRINDDRETIESSYWKYISIATQHKIQTRYKGNVELFKYWFKREVFLPVFEFISFVWDTIVNFLRSLRDVLISMTLRGSI